MVTTAPFLSTEAARSSAFATSAKHQVYDFIFAGAGCAALSTVMHLLQAGVVKDKKILLVDSDTKQRNDRTWCFWERDLGLFEPIVRKSWQQLHFYSNTFSGPLDIKPYAYKLVRGIDFYNYCLQTIKQHPNIELLQANVQSFENTAAGASLQTDKGVFEAFFLFNGIPPQQPKLKSYEYWLLQHFKGWMIETPVDVFNPEQATLMDFRVSQEWGTTFVYVLPFTPRKALVEYTLFSKELLPQPAYDKALQHYLHQYLNIKDYHVAEEEFGIIPMTNVRFPPRSGNIINIGTAGGYTKASSGYTFRAIQKGAAQIASSIKQHGHPFATKPASSRFHFYDSVLLHLLHYNKLPGDHIFAQLFQNNRGSDVFRFLDNESTLLQDVRLTTSLPIMPFTKAAANYLSDKWFK